MDDLQKANDLKKRLKIFRKEKKVVPNDDPYFLPSFSWGLRLGLEWIMRVLGWLGLGWGADYLFRTKPLGLMIGLIAGTIAGFIKVHRAFFIDKTKK